MLADGTGVVTGQLRAAGRHHLRGRRAGTNQNEVLAQAGKTVLQQQPRSFARRYHGDDGADANNDAETGQDRPPFVDQQGIQGNTNGGKKAHKKSSFHPSLKRKRRLFAYASGSDYAALPGESPEMEPSRTVIIRGPQRSMVGSCVTRTIVCLRSRLSRWNSRRISSLVRESRLPVGSSASKTWG